MAQDLGEGSTLGQARMFVFVGRYICMRACMHACMHTCKYACGYVSVYVCM